jgi:hypothetical protein
MHEDILTARDLLEKAEKLNDPRAIEILVEEGRELLEGCLEDDSLSSQEKESILRLKKLYARMLFNKLEQLNVLNFDSFRVFIRCLVLGFNNESLDLVQDPIFEKRFILLKEKFSEDMITLEHAMESLKKSNN